MLAKYYVCTLLMFCYRVKTYNQRQQLAPVLDNLRSLGKRIGFVPTMGALHMGHISLVDKALKQNDVVVVSIFVNPTQFNNEEDLKKYPRTLDRDVKMLGEKGENIILYVPSVEDLYGNNVVSGHFAFDGLERQMEGRFRPGHFDGVGTVVSRFFEIVKPGKAYFGKKDFQQLRIIETMVKNLKLPIKIIGCEIHREKDGLAMSSRNERLKPNYRDAAPFIFKTLKAAKKRFGTESAYKVTEWVRDQFAGHELLKLEYFVIADEETLQPVARKSRSKSYRAFIAVFADDIRLIDNIALN